MSEYAVEQEILFNILNDFIIQKVQSKVQNNKKVYYIQLNIFNSENEDFQQVFYQKTLFYSDAPSQVQLIFYRYSQKQVLSIYKQICRKVNLSSSPQDQLIFNYYKCFQCFVQKKLQKFIAAYEPSLCLIQKIQQQKYLKYVLFLLELASQVFYHFRQFDKIEQVISYLEKINSQQWKIEIKLRLCKAYFYLKKFKKSIQFFNQTIQQLQKQIQNEQDPEIRCDLLQSKFNIFQQYKNILAECKYKKSKEDSIQIKETIQYYFSSEFKKAEFYHQENKIDIAIQICQQLLKNLVQYQTTNINYLYKVLTFLSQLLMKNKKFDRALCYLFKLLPILIEIQGYRCWNYCKTISLITDCYFQMYKKSQAKQYYKLYLKQIQLSWQNLNEMQHYSHLSTKAIAYDRLGNLEMAIQNYLISGQYFLSIYKNQQHDNYMSNIANLASCYFRQGNISQALKLYQKYEKIINSKYQKWKMLGTYIIENYNLAILSQILGLYSKSIYYTKKLIQILKQQPQQNKKQIIFRLKLLASAYHSNHQVQQSILCYEQIFKMLKSLNFPINLCFDLGLYYYDIGDYYKSAFYHLKSVQNIIKNQQIWYPFLIVKSVWDLVNCYVNTGEFIGSLVGLVAVLQKLINIYQQKQIKMSFSQHQKFKLIKRIQKLKLDKCQNIAFCDM